MAEKSSVGERDVSSQLSPGLLFETQLFWRKGNRQPPEFYQLSFVASGPLLSINICRLWRTKQKEALSMLNKPPSSRALGEPARFLHSLAHKRCRVSLRLTPYSPKCSPGKSAFADGG